MFRIRLVPELGPDGERLGEITVGSFTERFSVYAEASATSKWKQELQALLAGAPVVALVHDPRFAWVIYREGDSCFIQQRMSLDGTFDNLLPRRRASDDGAKVSEWRTSVEEILRFVQA